MKKPFRVWSADRAKRYGIVAENFQNLKVKSAEKLGVKSTENIKLVLEEDGTQIDESYWEVLKDQTRLILLQPSEVWQPQPVWPPDIGHCKFDLVDGFSSGEKVTSEKLFMKLQQNPAIMVLLSLQEMEIIKDTDVDLIDGKYINKEMAKELQDKCVEIYLMKKKETEALEVIDLIKQKNADVCT